MSQLRQAHQLQRCCKRFSIEGQGSVQATVFLWASACQVNLSSSSRAELEVLDRLGDRSSPSRPPGIFAGCVSGAVPDGDLDIGGGGKAGEGIAALVVCPGALGQAFCAAQHYRDGFQGFALKGPYAAFYGCSTAQDEGVFLRRIRQGERDGDSIPLAQSNILIM